MAVIVIALYGLTWFSCAWDVRYFLRSELFSGAWTKGKILYCIIWFLHCNVTCVFAGLCADIL